MTRYRLKSNTGSLLAKSQITSVRKLDARHPFSINFFLAVLPPPPPKKSTQYLCT